MKMKKKKKKKGGERSSSGVQSAQKQQIALNKTQTCKTKTKDNAQVAGYIVIVATTFSIYYSLPKTALSAQNIEGFEDSFI
jgi:hypothetical protein